MNAKELSPNKLIKSQAAKKKKKKKKKKPIGKCILAILKQML